MAAVLERPGAPPPPPASADHEDEQYSCDCAGFKGLDVMKMCLRCLEAYTAGLPHAGLSDAVVKREMRRVGVRLGQLLKHDPLIANLPIDVVIGRSR